MNWKKMLFASALVAPALFIAGALTSGEANASMEMQRSGATVGQAAPSFTLVDTRGQRHSLSDFRGRTVVLEWFNDGCPFVKKFYESGHKQRLQQRFRDQNVVWLLVVSSATGEQGYHSAAGHNQRISDWNINANALLIDTNGQVGRAYGAQTTPHMFIIDREGVLRYNGAMDDRPTANPNDIAAATPLFANALEAVLAGRQVQNATNRPYGCSVKYAN